MNDALRSEIESLRQLKVRELKKRYIELFGEASASSNQLHLVRRLAWRLQAQAEGDLSERAQKRAADLAQDVDLRLRAPRSFWRELDRADTRCPRDPRLPTAGTQLRRSYQGRTIVVQVLEHGFAYDNQKYGSLSAIAYRVTGTRWNGYLFFGLNEHASR
jgi:hypothetical protein